jgi:hypothetical protein
MLNFGDWVTLRFIMFKKILILLSLTISGCAHMDYKYQGVSKKAEKIDFPTYSVIVPSITIFDTGHWDRYSKEKHLEDLTLKTGWRDESYVASVQLKKNSSIKNIQDLKNAKSSNRASFKNAVLTKTNKDSLICIKTEMQGYVKKYPQPSFFMLSMACIDTTTKIFYEVCVSEMDYDDRGSRNNPTSRFFTLAEKFFSDFSVK